MLANATLYDNTYYIINTMFFNFVFQEELSWIDIDFLAFIKPPTEANTIALPVSSIGEKIKSRSRKKSKRRCRAK